MRRRDFLYQTGLLVPALALAPSRVLANAKQESKVVLIQSAAFRQAGSVAEILRKSSPGMVTVQPDDIRTIRRSATGFALDLTGGRLLETAKLILDVEYSVKHDEAAVDFKADGTQQRISFKRKGEALPPPEFWSLRTGRNFAEDIALFLKSNKPAFACISHS
jgi:hypothetical protein